MKYIVVKTFCNNRDIANKIIDNLLKEKLVAGAQIEETNSTYYWNDELVNTKEYKLEFRSKETLFEEIKCKIKEIHNYEVPEISAFEIIKANEEIFNWIDENTKNI